MLTSESVNISRRSSVQTLLSFSFCSCVIAGLLSFSTPTPARAQSIPESGLRMEVYENIPGNTVDDLLSSDKYPDQPDRTEYVEEFEAPADVMENYGVRLSGYLIPPTTGDYVFWMASDDGGALFLSSDEEPANSTMIANVPGWTSSRQWDRYPEQMSDAIRLEASKSYYVEALMKEQGGGDNLAVRWRLPNGEIEEPIPNSRLLPFGISFEPPAIEVQPQDTTGVENESATFSVTLSTVGPVKFQWFKDTFPVPGANEATWTLDRLSLADSGVTVHVELKNDQGTTLSQEATLTVTPDVSPPELISGLNLGLNQILLTFSEPLETNSASLTDNFFIESGIEVIQAEPDAEGLTVTLTVDPLLELGETYTLNVQNVTDKALTPNPIGDDAQIEIEVTQYTPIDIGFSIVPGGSESIPNGIALTGGGSGLGTTSDQFHFSYQQRSGDFDVQGRVEGFNSVEGSINQLAKAGWMVRENLASNARYVAALTTPSPLEGAFMQYRQSAGQTSAQQGAYPVSYPNQWLRLKRQGSRITAYAGPDGQTWYEMGEVNLTLPSTVFVGLAVTSSASNSAVAARWTSLGETPTNQPGTELPPLTREPLGPSSRGTNLVISEIMYHPLTISTTGNDANAGGAESLEFIEIYNSQPFTEDLSGFRVSGDIDFSFPSRTTMAPGSFLVVAKSPSALIQRYKFLDPNQVLGPFTGSLPDNAGRVRLRNRIDGVLLDVEYEDTASWPIEADGAGHSLVLANASYGQGRTEAWAASRHRGGSPGSQDPLFEEPGYMVVINEILSNSEEPTLDFVEIYNKDSNPIDLTGWVLTDDPAIEKFTFPIGTAILDGQSHIVLDEASLGFGISSTGESVYLIQPSRNRVVDAIRLEGALPNVSWGRYPDGADDEMAWQETPTPGESNAGFSVTEIVIHEIMYNPISGLDDDEYIEIYNASESEIDLSGWRFTDGVDWTFPPETMIQTGAYLVITPNRDRMLSRYKDLDPALVLGNYQGSLSNFSERIALAQPVINLEGQTGWALVDEVYYQDGGRWGNWSNGDGSSLELIDPLSDNSKASNWADSDETEKGEWTTVEFTGLLDNGRNTPNELHVMLLGAGECLIDDIEVFPAGSANRISNGNFESNTTGWIFQGNHVLTEWYRSEGFNSSRSLLLRASGGGDNGANRIEVNLTSAMSAGQTGTLRAKARWRVGSPLLLLRLYGNYLEAVGELPVPTNLGTPGQPNSRAVNNAGPSIESVTHFPPLPRAGEAVTVTARVSDPDSLSNVSLRYRRDPSNTLSTVAMRDDGLGVDATANDGVFSAQIPGQGSGSLVAFHIEASDQNSFSASSKFPAEDPDLNPECLVRFNDSFKDTALVSYRFWITQSNLNTWSQRENLSNQALDVTFVYNNYRVIYNAGGRYRGSPFIRPNYNTPTSSLAALLLKMPKDDPLFGETELNLDWLEQPGRDDTFQREKISFWIANQINAPFSHQKYIHLSINGSPRGEIYTDSQQPNAEYVSQWFPGDTEGEIFKIDDWFEFNDNVQREFNEDGRLAIYTTTGGEKKKARYRWSWEKKSNGSLNDDYNQFFDLVDAVNSSNDVYTEQVLSHVDIDQWMKVIAVRHIVGDWDGYGYNRGKNMFMYNPEYDRWKLMLWDMDFALGAGGDGPNTGLFGANDPVVTRMFNHPPFRRSYMRAMKLAVEGPLTAQNVSPVAKENFDALRAAGVNAASTRAMLSWIGSRRAYILSQLAPIEIDFAVDAPPGNIINATDSLVILTGTAPVEVASIQVNGVEYNVEWTTINRWRIRLALTPGDTSLSIVGFDERGVELEGMTADVTVRLNSEIEPAEGSIVINEIHANPGVEFPEAEFVEIYNQAESTSFDLSGWRLDGVDLDLPGGLIIAPGEYLVFAKNLSEFSAAQGGSIPVAAIYPGTLQDGGELIQLLRPNTANSSGMLLVDEVYYSTQPPWPLATAGHGSSLQLRNPGLDNRRIAAWAASGENSDPIDPVEVIALNHSWKYQQDGVDLGTSWSRTNFDDADWDEGQGLLYVEGSALPGPKNTPLTLGSTTYYFRGEFEHPHPDAGSIDIQLSTVVDDGCIIYLNGEEIYRIGLPDGQVGFNTLANRTVGNASVEGPFTISGSALKPGSNTLAAEIHQTSTGSSDVVFGMTMTLVSAEQSSQSTPGRANSVQAPFTKIPELWLNELQYGPQTSLEDPNGINGAWVEIYNAGADMIALDQLSLSRGSVPEAAWNFPNGSQIAPGGFRTIRLDGREDLHTEADWRSSIELPAPQEATPAADSNIQLNWRPTQGAAPLALDSMGPMVDWTVGRSLGAFPDGSIPLHVIFVNPTPGASNGSDQPEDMQIWINEWMAANASVIADPADGLFEDWIELFNPNSANMDLSGYTLTDDLTDPGKWAFPTGTQILGNGFLLIWADNDPEQTGPGTGLHTNFRLSADGETIAIYTPAGKLVDLVEFGAMTDDQSFGRNPDGAANSIVSILNPSPGKSNTADPTVAPALTATIENGTVSLHWLGKSGYGYQLQSTGSLENADWVSAGSEQSGVDEPMSWTDSNSIGTSTRFFRLIVIRP